MEKTVERIWVDSHDMQPTVPVWYRGPMEHRLQVGHIYRARTPDVWSWENDWSLPFIVVGKKRDKWASVGDDAVLYDVLLGDLHVRGVYIRITDVVEVEL